MKQILISCTLLLVCGASLQAATFFTEDFSSNTAGPNLGISPGGGSGVDFTGGNAVFLGSGDGARTYVRTNDSDYNGGSFQSFSTVTIFNGSGGGNGLVFYGMGAGTRNAGQFQEPSTSPSVVMRPGPDDFGGGGVAFRDNGAETFFNNNTAGGGTHRLGMRYDSVSGKMEFAIQKNYAGGAFTPTTVWAGQNIADNGLNGTNSHVFFGGTSNSVFDDVIVQADSGSFLGQLSEPAAGFWGIREVINNGAIANLAGAKASIASGNGIIVEGRAPVINFVDPDDGGGGGQVGGNIDFLSDQNGNDQNFVQQAKGRIKIETAGQYTFYAQGDDGFSLTIDGVNWDSVSDTGDGTAMISGDEFFNDFAGGNVNGFGVITLAEGEYDLEYLFYEIGGGAYNELWAAFGSFSSFDSNAFDLIGDVANGGLELVGPAQNVEIPEPASLALWSVLGALLFGWARRRRGKK